MKPKNERKINWGEARANIERGLRLLEEGRIDPQRAEAIYRKRARQLATRRAQTQRPGALLSALTMTMGSETYAVEIRWLAEILPLAKVIPVPEAPSEVAGVINVRSDIIPVIDCSKLLELPTTGEAVGTSYVLLLRRPGRQSVGLKVDRVGEIRSIAQEEVTGMDRPGSASSASMVKGITRDGFRLLDMERLFLHPVFKEETA